MIPNLRNMLIQDEMFFEGQGGEVKARGLRLIAMFRELMEERREPVFSASRATYQVAELQSAIKKWGWKPNIIARELGVDVSTVYNRIDKYRLRLKAAS